MGIFILLCVQNLLGFFIYQPANKIRTIGDYVGMHALYFLRGNARSYGTQYQLLNPKLCLYSSPANIRSWNILHAVEQRNYFLSQFPIELQPKEDSPDNEIIIQRKKDQSDACTYQHATLFEKQIYCPDNNYMCPKGYKGTISIFYDRLL